MKKPLLILGFSLTLLILETRVTPLNSRPTSSFAMLWKITSCSPKFQLLRSWNLVILINLQRIQNSTRVFRLIFISCGINDFKRQEDKIRPLVARKATKSEVVVALGTTFLLYSKGQSSWEVLNQVLLREGPNRMVAVRQRLPSSSSVMLYSTPEMMTWVFLDANEKIVDFVVGAQ